MKRESAQPVVSTTEARKKRKEEKLEGK